MKKLLFLIISLLSLTAQATPLDSLVTYPDWQTLSVPVKLSIDTPMKQKVSATMTMQRGQWITCSVRMLGMEVAVLSVDNDSIFAVDRWHKIYVAESTQKMLAGFPASVTDLQQLLLGQFFVLGADKEVTVSQPDSGMTIVTPVFTPENVNYAFQTTCDDAPDALVAVIKGSQPVSVIYGDVWDTPCGPTAETVIFDAFLGKMKLSANLEIDYKKAKYNTGLRGQGLPGFRGYKKRDIRQFLQMLDRKK